VAEGKREDSHKLLVGLHEDLKSHMVWEEEYNKNINSVLGDIRKTLKVTKSTADEAEHDVIWMKRIAYTIGSIVLMYGIWLFSSINNIENSAIERGVTIEKNENFYKSSLLSIHKTLEEVKNDLRSER
jgi:hypothetical protein